MIIPRHPPAGLVLLILAAPLAPAQSSRPADKQEGMIVAATIPGPLTARYELLRKEADDAQRSKCVHAFPARVNARLLFTPPAYWYDRGYPVYAGSLYCDPLYGYPPASFYGGCTSYAWNPYWGYTGGRAIHRGGGRHYGYSHCGSFSRAPVASGSRTFGRRRSTTIGTVRVAPPPVIGSIPPVLGERK